MSIDLLHFTIDKARFEKILDFLPYPFLISQYRDGTHHNIYLNTKFVNEIGYQLQDIPTIDDWFILAYPDEVIRAKTIADWTLQFEQAQNKGKDFAVMKVLIHTKSNDDRWYEVKASLLGPIHFVAFIDIHQEIIYEKELENLNATNNVTLSILSHDLRSPVTQLRSLTALFLQDQLPKTKFIALTQQVNQKSQQVLDLLDTTLLWTKSNFNQIATNDVEVDLQKIVNDIMGIYDFPLREKNLSVCCEMEGELKSDPEIISIVMRNLLSNAIKFTNENGIISILSKNENNHTTIIVHNTGVAIDPLLIEQILSPDSILKNNIQREMGHGIGLKLCRQLIEKIKGVMEIESQQGEGTAIKLLLPSK